MFFVLQQRMRHYLKRMPSRGQDRAEYMAFVQGVFDCLMAHLNGHVKLLDFFMKASPHYTPKDPKMFRVLLVQYCLDLRNESTGLARKMFYFLYHSWQDAISSSSPATNAYFTSIIQEGLRYPRFMLFLLEDFIPTCLEGSLARNMWPILHDFLTMIASRVKAVLKASKKGNDHANIASRVFLSVSNIVFEATNGINPRDFQRSTLAVVLLFWKDVSFEMSGAYMYKLDYPRRLFKFIDEFWGDLTKAFLMNQRIPYTDHSIARTKPRLLQWNDIKNDESLFEPQSSSNTEVDVKGRRVILSVSWARLFEDM